MEGEECLGAEPLLRSNLKMAEGSQESASAHLGMETSDVEMVKVMRSRPSGSLNLQLCTEWYF